MAGLYLAAFVSVGLCAEIRIHDIQGRGHESPFVGQTVKAVPGIVTALRPHGFYMQDDMPDGDRQTSEAIFVYAQPRPSVEIGDAVRVSGMVVEHRVPACPANSHGSTHIELSDIGIAARGQALPPPIVFGAEGANMPDWRLVDINAAIYFPALYESMEGMRVRVPEARAVEPGAAWGLSVAVEGMSPHTLFSPRGALLIREWGGNPQRLMFLSQAFRLTEVKTGDRLNEAVGILDQAQGHYALSLEASPLWRDGNLQPEAARPAAADEFSLAVYNVENLDVRDPSPKFEGIATQIVRNLHSPDIVGLLEVQDDSGPRDDGNTSASRTLERLVDAIARLGGPRYAWAAVDPRNNEDGGQPGGNIRQVLLYDTRRVALALTRPPLRIGEEEGAFRQSRKPLVAAFEYRGLLLTVLVNHFVSKRGDALRCGIEVPSPPASEPQRMKQARIVADHVRTQLARDPQARVLVIGDLNDFEFSNVLRTLQEAGLSNPAFKLPAEERYSYIHDGNAQMLDHILLSPALVVSDFDIVHVNAEFPPEMRASDHDPLLLRLRLPGE